jgi:hypothetical protein
MRSFRALAALFVALCLAACGEAAAPATDLLPSTGGATASAPGSAAASSTASVPASEPAEAGPGSAPAELAGTWRRVVQGETVLLTLEGTGYNIQRAGNIGSGQIEVTSDQIRFFDSTLCDGEGVYTWTFEEDRLRLTEIEEDPCSGRTDVLLRGTFGRVDP